MRFTPALLLLELAACSSPSRIPSDGGGPPSDLSTPERPPGPKITICPGASRPAPSSGTCETTPGSGGMLITASVLTPGEVLRGGQVLIDGAGKIACLGCECPAGTATLISCPAGVLSPGLIN